MKKNIIIILVGLCLLCFALFVQAGQNQTEENQSTNPMMIYAEEDWEDITFLTSAKHQRRLEENKQVHHQIENDPLAFYSDFKEAVDKMIGLQFGMDISFTAQRLSPNGKQTAIQAIYYPYAVWTLFKDKGFWGTAELNFSYNLVRYWGQEASVLQERGGIVNSINDYPSKDDTFSEMAFTHTWGDALSWFSWTVGQYPISNFDGTTYDSNEQTGLINYVLAQNATQAYPSSSLGAYIQITPLENLTISGGYQDAHNVSGNKIEFDTAFDGKYTGFAAISYNFNLFGKPGQYSALGYYQPSVEEQEGYTWGWSLNSQQGLTEKLTIFNRINGISEQILPISRSYVLGLAYKNPLDRNPLDVITFAAAYNQLSAQGLGYPVYNRAYEMAFEAQWVWGFSQYLTITPDIQVYPNAGLNSEEEFVTVVSLRTTFMF